MCHSGAMFVFVIIAIVLLALFWQYILAAFGIWMFVLIMRAVINWTVADARPEYRRKPVPVRPVAKPVQARPRPVARQAARPQPARELPAPDYLPRWTARRRLDTGREHAQWQKAFDSAA